jgi:glycosyltransferase involved in cell wall biosynthesis
MISSNYVKIMKAVIVLPYLKSMGGASRYGWELSEFMASKGDEITISCITSVRSTFKSNESISIVDLADESYLPQTIKYWLNFSKIRKNLKLLILKVNPDVVVFINWPTSMWVDNFNDIPIVFSPLDIQILYSDTYTKNLKLSINWIWKFIRFFVRIYEKSKWKYFDSIIASSKFTAKHIYEIYKIKSEVIYLGANDEFFKTNPKKSRAILCLGDIKARNALFLLHAAEKLYKKRQDFEIWIAGDKELHGNELKQLSNELGLKNIVKFFGKVSDKKLASLYADSSVFIHLVKDAPFGMQVIEAMASGTPVISWKPGGPEESITQNETGFLIPQFNYDELIKHIELFLDDPELTVKMGNKAREHAKTFFTSNDIYSQIRNFIITTIAKKNLLKNNN